jgi:cell division protein ZapA
MDQESEILKINIFGTEYPIKSDSATETEYIQKVAEYVDKKMREIDTSAQAKSSLKVAILAALNITDELFQERLSKESLHDEISGKLKRLSDTLEQGISKQEND